MDIMETTQRTIMVAKTRTQKKYKITTNATTLGELKQCLADNGIEYEGLSFTEGHTKTTLIDDSSLIPTCETPVFLLTNTTKKIQSGLSREELYRTIKDNGYQEAVKDRFGRSYTSVSTKELDEFVSGLAEDSTDGDDSGDDDSDSCLETSWDDDDTSDEGDSDDNERPVASGDTIVTKTVQSVVTLLSVLTQRGAMSYDDLAYISRKAHDLSLTACGNSIADMTIDEMMKEFC